jgi:hypothetical protein
MVDPIAAGCHNRICVHFARFSSRVERRSRPAIPWLHARTVTYVKSLCLNVVFLYMFRLGLITQVNLFTSSLVFYAVYQVM